MRHDFPDEPDTWRSAFGKTAGLVLGVAALMAAGVYYLICISGPRLVITHDGAEVRIEPQFLEYDLGVNRLLLEDVSKNRPVLDASANDEKPMLVIRLKPGLQDLTTLIGPDGRAVDGERPILISGILYAVYSLNATAHGLGAKHVATLRDDLRAEVQRGGAMGVVCRLIQPLIWLLTLPMDSLTSALALAGCLACAGMLL